jgi:hypothetical protein
LKSSVLIVAGESSGEKYGAALVREYRSLDPSVSFFGIGGPEMAAAGVDILHPMNDLAVVGLTEVLVHIPRIRRILKSLTRTAREKKPRAAVLIDAPDFNLRLARFVKKGGDTRSLLCQSDGLGLATPPSENDQGPNRAHVADFSLRGRNLSQGGHSSRLCRPSAPG